MAWVVIRPVSALSSLVISVGSLFYRHGSGMTGYDLELLFDLLPIHYQIQFSARLLVVQMKDTMYRFTDVRFYSPISVIFCDHLQVLV